MSLDTHFKPQTALPKTDFFPPSPWSILLVLMYLNLNPDLNTYNRVNNHHQIWKWFFFCFLTGAGHHQQKTGKPVPQRIYLFKSIPLLLFMVFMMLLSSYMYISSRKMFCLWMYECGSVGRRVAWISNKIKREDSFVSLLCYLLKPTDGQWIKVDTLESHKNNK